ncbi:hypothetical protein Nepgr_024622 [Nepenthes gracilis]|uniref:O-fucosyltransferase family protein n=1 Tax=Nepenthes gracilis TaxID=150966 RepID=A0AAD3T4V8_NEPGR|nr:hypothetical protein Nepgr_024622 [Nepenthes gracilis]
MAIKAKWKKQNSQRSLLCFSLLTIPFLLLFFLFLFYKQDSPSVFRLSTNSLYPCSMRTHGERFLWYVPHSGFSNQLLEFKNAILLAAILNRKLIVPPVLDHHAVALGSCPKFRVLSPNELRIQVWDHAIELIRTGRYVSMTDILDISSISSIIRTIDFRDFVSLWCGVDWHFACLNDSNTQSSQLDTLRQCGSLLSGLKGNVDDCLYAIDEDCKSTVWTYQQNDDGRLDFFQPDEQLRMKKKFSYVRRRRDVYKKLGPGSKAHFSTVLAFGSLFTARYRGSELYIDIHESRNDRRIQSLIWKSEFIPFVADITNAGRKYSSNIIKEPFFCAQLRLLDGQFKNHWKSTFSGLQQMAESLKRKNSLPVHIFVMTDLPKSNWTGTYLGDLASDTNSFKLHVIRKEDDFVRHTAEKIATSSLGMRSGSVRFSSGQANTTKWHCPNQFLPDILLYVEETVCSCASLGFVGTAGSTIAESIELMRKNAICSG